MSDEESDNSIRIVVAGAEFWHYAALVWVELSLSKAGSHAIPENESLELRTDKGKIFFTTNGKQTIILAWPETNEDKRTLNAVFSKVKEVGALAYDLRRITLGHTFTEILDAYYAAKERGERPSLNAMAEFAGVNYDSLRQAKVRYDAKLREKKRV